MRKVMTPASRRTDPSTSYDAERCHNRSGERIRQQEIALQLVRLYPSRTSDELAEFGSLNRYQLARRLPELVTAGAVEKGEPRKSFKTGRKALTWNAK